MAGVRKMVYGVGINDSPFTEPQHIYEYDSQGKKKLVGSCPYYIRWRSIIQRCYHVKTLTKYPAYVGCSVSEDWKYLSNFIKWVDEQPNRDWENLYIDKDLLYKGNKIYSDETCIFIDREVNNFLLDRRNHRGEFLLGVTSSNGKFRARINNPMTKSELFLGNFSTEYEAHLAWRAKETRVCLYISRKQTDHRVANALQNYYI